MRITIDIDSYSEMEQLSAIFDKFKINVVQLNASAAASKPIVRGDKKINPKDLFGIWANKPRSLEDIRNSAWNRKQNDAQ